jgi:hypothetical protein
MSARFTPCPSCARHVKQSDSRCPFCGNEVPPVNAPSARVAVGRLSRSALFAAGAAGLALATTDCGSMSSDYGGPPCPANGCGDVEVNAPFGDASGEAASEDASGDATDGSPSTPDADAGEAGPTEGGSDGAVMPPTDGGEAGH